MGLINTLYYHWRRSNWLIDPRRFISDYVGVSIDRPIFFVGNQGGGLTLIVRMLRRHPDLVSIVGNHRHWSGPDEMQRVMELRLPKSLKLARLPYQIEVDHKELTAPRSWSYATDALLPAYRKTEKDYAVYEAERFRYLIREALFRFGKNSGKGVRFVDKSQVFTVKLRFIQALLEDTEPFFVLITRNPYVACYRAATGKAIDMARYARHMDLQERITLCAQHWANAMRCSIEDARYLTHFKAMRFEDFLLEPEVSMQELCAFLELDYSSDLLPQSHHTIPLGSRFSDRWYPLKKEVNQAYLEKLEPSHISIIEQNCASLAQQWGYMPPKGT